MCFVLDLTVFACAAVLLHSFAAGRSYSGAVRWYMVVGTAAGLWGYFFVLAPGLGTLRSLAEWLVLLPVRLTWITAVRPVGRLCGRRLERTREKLHSAMVKRQTKTVAKKRPRCCIILINTRFKAYQKSTPANGGGCRV